MRKYSVNKGMKRHNARHHTAGDDKCEAPIPLLAYLSSRSVEIHPHLTQTDLLEGTRARRPIKGFSSHSLFSLSARSLCVCLCSALRVVACVVFRSTVSMLQYFFHRVFPVPSPHPPIHANAKQPPIYIKAHLYLAVGGHYDARNAGIYSETLSAMSLSSGPHQNNMLYELYRIHHLYFWSRNAKDDARARSRHWLSSNSDLYSYFSVFFLRAWSDMKTCREI